MSLLKRKIESGKKNTSAFRLIERMDLNGERKVLVEVIYIISLVMIMNKDP
jgi:hypothetical protein